MKRSALLIACFFLLLLPTSAQANAGTPLMWASVIHLFIGNLVIGIVEGLLLAFIFRCSKLYAPIAMILANYTSAWAGRWLLAEYIAPRMDITIENVAPWFWGFVILAFLFTLVIEFPFVWLALKIGKRNSLKRAALGTLAINCISYLFLFGWYGAASGTGIMNELKVVPVAEMGAPGGYALYYITGDGRAVMRSDLSGNKTEMISKIEFVNTTDQLPARPNRQGKMNIISGMGPMNTLDRLLALPNDRGSMDLLLQRATRESEPERREVIRRDFATRAPSEPEFIHPANQPVPKVEVESDWEYMVSPYYAQRGIQGYHEKSGTHFRFSMETPFITWALRNATHVAGDFVVFQLGRDQICLLQPQEKKIALITRGKAPLVAK